MFNDIPEDVCSSCLPDCVNTVYHPVMTALPFKVCDESNLGSSYFCTLDDPGVNVKKLVSSLLTTRPNKLECLYLAITFQSSVTFAGNTRSLPKKEASERRSNWVGSGPALKF
jgi:hypothetical protein